MKIDWKQKLTSRKFWMAVAAFVASLFAAFGHEEVSQNVTGTIMAGATVIAYLLAEGIADSNRTTSIDEDIEDDIDEFET